jgi:hypothetical protein
VSWSLYTKGGCVSLLVFDAGVGNRAGSPDAGAVFRVRAGSDEGAVHGSVMVAAEGEAVKALAWTAAFLIAALNAKLLFDR